MADCKPRIKPQPETEPVLPVVGDCCLNDGIERGWYNELLVRTCPNAQRGRIVVPYATFRSTESQAAADQLAETYAQEQLSQLCPPDPATPGFFTLHTGNAGSTGGFVIPQNSPSTWVKSLSLGEPGTDFLGYPLAVCGDTTAAIVNVSLPDWSASVSKHFAYSKAGAPWVVEELWPDGAMTQDDTIETVAINPNLEAVITGSTVTILRRSSTGEWTQFAPELDSPFEWRFVSVAYEPVLGKFLAFGQTTSTNDAGKTGVGIFWSDEGQYWQVGDQVWLDDPTFPNYNIAVGNGIVSVLMFTNWYFALVARVVDGWYYQLTFTSLSSYEVHLGPFYDGTQFVVFAKNPGVQGIAIAMSTDAMNWGSFMLTSGLYEVPENLIRAPNGLYYCTQAEYTTGGDTSIYSSPDLINWTRYITAPAGVGYVMGFAYGSWPVEA